MRSLAGTFDPGYGDLSHKSFLASSTGSSGAAGASSAALPSLLPGHNPLETARVPELAKFATQKRSWLRGQAGHSGGASFYVARSLVMECKIGPWYTAKVIG